MIKKYFSLVIISFSILVLLFTIFKAEIIFEGKKMYYYKYYYFTSFSLIIFSILTIFLSEKIKQYMLIVGLSILSVLYIYEYFLSSAAYKKITEISRTTVYEKLIKESDKRVSLTIGPGNYLKDKLDLYPLSGMSNSLTIHCNENGYMSMYDSDRYGFNNPDEEWDKSSIKFLLTGDSFTGGACVNRPHDIASVLRKKTSEGSITLGYGGNAPLIEYAALKEYVNKNVNIENIVWLFTEGNDVEGLYHELDNEILIKYVLDDKFTQNLINKQDQVDQIVKNYISNKRHELNQRRTHEEESLKNKTKLFFKLYYLRNSIIKPTAGNDLKNILELANKFSIENNSKFSLVYLPAMERYSGIYYRDANYNALKSMTSDLGINFIDVHKNIFQKEKDPLLLFSKFGHYTIEGYEKIANLILKRTN
ncbi:hypothetical protein N9O63_02800 [Candidatus Pelagibacter sp.]|nr:hypothetical protein [Candidatus Pelagibacter sp.]